MNILFITPSIPSQFHRRRSLDILTCLSRVHGVYLVSLAASEQVDTREIAPFCKKMQFVYQSRLRSFLLCALYLFSSLPLEVAYCRNKKMNAAIRDIVNRNAIDVIYIKRLRSAQFVDADITVPCVLDTTDAMSLFYERAYHSAKWLKKILFWEEWTKYRMYEHALFARFKNWIVCSPVDISYLQQQAPSDVLFHYVPNVVDTDWYRATSISPKTHTILFSGLMDKFVNIEAAHYFIQEIFPFILQKFPDTKLSIVGPNPPHSLKKLISKNIIVTGHVADIRDSIAQSAVVVCPIKTGTGTRFKILQAWSIGRPVVTTSAGVEGLDAQDCHDLLIRNTPQDFAEAVCTLFTNHELANHLVKNARTLVGTTYSLHSMDNAIHHAFTTL